MTPETIFAIVGYRDIALHAYTKSYDAHDTPS